jgi:predicted dehydrogenase
MIEYEQSIRAGFIGCGGHALRNVYTTFPFAPVDLIAVCDRDEARAKTAALQFGATSHYTDHQRMLTSEELDAVFIVTGYDDGRPTYPGLAIDCMQAGCHAWIEKPPASSVAEIEEMQAAEKETGKFVLVGLKKAFFPTIRKMKEITLTDEFGGLSSLSLKYPQYIPNEDEKVLKGRSAMVGFLDHIVHPGSIIDTIGGPIRHIYYDRSSLGSCVVSIQFTSGAVGSLHLSAGSSSTSPLERVEAVGRGENVVVDNGVRLTYYRKGRRGPGGYGSTTNFIGDDATAPILWEPEWSLGQLYNKGIFLLGYAFEVIEFAECVLENRRPDCGNLESARRIMQLFEAFYHPPGQVIPIGS